MSADLLRKAARELRHMPGTSYDEPLADWLDAAAEIDGRGPHKMPHAAAESDAIVWVCEACDATVGDGYFVSRRDDCPVDWRPRDPHALAVARAILGRDQAEQKKIFALHDDPEVKADHPDYDPAWGQQ